MAKQEITANRKSQYQFVNTNQLVNLWVRTYYPNKHLVIIYNCSSAFINIPYLSILKRDDLSSYILGLISDICFIDFETIEKAKDFVLMFSHNQASYSVYSDGDLILTNLNGRNTSHV